MNEFNATPKACETVSALDLILDKPRVRQYPAYVGLDVHKETIAVAVAHAGRGAPQFRREIANTPKAVAKLVARLSQAWPRGVVQLRGRAVWL